MVTARHKYHRLEQLFSKRKRGSDVPQTHKTVHRPCRYSTCIRTAVCRPRTLSKNIVKRNIAGSGQVKFVPDTGRSTCNPSANSVVFYVLRTVEKTFQQRCFFRKIYDFVFANLTPSKRGRFAPRYRRTIGGADDRNNPRSLRFSALDAFPNGFSLVEFTPPIHLLSFPGTLLLFVQFVVYRVREHRLSRRKM